MWHQPVLNRDSTSGDKSDLPPTVSELHVNKKIKGKKKRLKKMEITGHINSHGLSNICVFSRIFPHSQQASVKFCRPS